MAIDTKAVDMIARTIAVIEAEGEDGVRVVDIAKHVGVAVTTLFHLFGNRESLILVAQVERYVRGQATMIQDFDVATALAHSTEDFRAVVIRMVRHELSASQATIRISRQGVLGSAFGRTELSQAIITSQLSMSTGLQVALDRALENKWIDPKVDTMAVAYWILGLFNSRVMIESAPTQVDRRAWDAMTLAAILRILFVD